MKDRIKDYFSFNRGEQRGLAILLGILLCSLVVKYLLVFFLPDEEFDMAPFKQDVEQFLAELKAADSINSIKPAVSPAARYPQADDLGNFLQAPFEFDPNRIDEATWQQIGLNGKVISNILKYRQKGGKFKVKNDLARIYGFEDSTFRKLAPFILIVEEEKPKHEANRNSTRPDIPDIRVPAEMRFPKPVELNAADSIELTTLPGIGPAFAGRIIGYRDLLGGYHRREQLLEVRGMDSVRYDGIRNLIVIDTMLIRKMDLNTVTFKEMLRHPYFEYYLVKLIFRYRDEVKTIDSVAQLRHLDEMYEELFGKIRPYLSARPEQNEAGQE